MARGFLSNQRASTWDLYGDVMRSGRICRVLQQDQPQVGYLTHPLPQSHFRDLIPVLA